MSDASVANLIAYSLQLAWLAAVSSLVPMLVRIDSAALRHRYWRGVLAVSLLLPWLQGRDDAGTAITTSFASMAPAAIGLGTTTVSGGLPGAGVISWLSVAAGIAAAGIVLRLAAVAIGLRRVRHLRAAGQIAPASPIIEQLQSAIGARAEIRYVQGLAQPVTFGLRHPIVLLPDTLVDHSESIQRAVLCHELLHVRRRDWVWVVAEAVVRAVLWFHPAVWWLVSRVQSTREEVVDELAVDVTGQRKAYVEALMAFADRPPLSVPAAAFSQRRHLFRRMMLIAKEGAMSRKRVLFSSIVMTLLVLAGIWYGATAFPLKATPAPEGAQNGPGTLERRAQPITPENPVPRRTHSVTPQYPAELAAAAARATVLLRVTLDESGRVAEVRRVAVPRMGGLGARGAAGGTDAAVAGMIDALVNSAIDAVRQWQYEPPANGPIAFDVTVMFEPGSGTIVIAPNAALAPRSGGGFVPPPPPPPPSPSPWPDAIRLGQDSARPKLVKRVNPVYPQDARDAGIAGVVVLEARIDTDGRVSDVRVIESIPELDEAAMDAVRQWEYEPALLNGEPVAVAMRITIRFTLT